MRIKWDDQHDLWFTSEGVKEIPIEIISRVSENHWMKIHQEASQIPFRFNERPAIRFILVHSPDISELIILSHHIICDGLSLAYLARDLMVHLGDPAARADWSDVTWPIGPDVVYSNYTVTQGSEYIDFIRITGLEVWVIQKCLKTPAPKKDCGFIVIEIEAVILEGPSEGQIMVEAET